MKQQLLFIILVALLGCSKNENGPAGTPTPTPTKLVVSSYEVNGVSLGNSYKGVNKSPVITIKFNTSINTATAADAISLSNDGNSANITTSFVRGDSSIIIKPAAPLAYLSRYVLTVATSLKSKENSTLSTPLTINLQTGIDSFTNKFPVVSDDQLLTLVQQQTFKYFWDFGHSVSGLARERNTSGDLVTSGGSGFGIMAIVAGISRNFITRSEGLARIQKMTTFLKTNAQKFHGAFPHWLNGATGQVIPFSAKDNGADLVETSFLIQGLLTARQFFDGGSAAETALRNDINSIWHGVEWTWFQRSDESVLYWHWSPNFGWDMNHKIKGWNECLITYALAASSPTYPIRKGVYDSGWASNGAMINNNTYYNTKLPLGPDRGGPLFFAHYSFLGINPLSLVDAYANYEVQNKAHATINYTYCTLNPSFYYGYSDSCWGLTASDIKNGYTASSPTNDIGVIAPTAALASFPYTPVESMKALKFFYYRLGDKIFKEYGFIDAFSLDDLWFANSFLAIDQGPIIIMIENYRTKLLWNKFMSCPEVKIGMKRIGFTSPNL